MTINETQRGGGIYMHSKEGFVVPLPDQLQYQTAPYFRDLKKQVIHFVDEEFRPIEGHENFLVSNYGRVYSNKVNCMMNEFGNKDGYLRCNVDSVPHRIHSLVAKAFIPNPDPEHKKCVNHKSGRKPNNYITNLEWCTYSENAKHAYEHGLEKPQYGEKNGRSTHTEAEVRQICSFLEQGISVREIADKMGYDFSKSKRFLYHLSSKSTWPHVTKDYNY